LKIVNFWPDPQEYEMVIEAEIADVSNGHCNQGLDTQVQRAGVANQTETNVNA
jgi:hypothetical protein